MGARAGDRRRQWPWSTPPGRRPGSRTLRPGQGGGRPPRRHRCAGGRSGAAWDATVPVGAHNRGGERCVCQGSPAIPRNDWGSNNVGPTVQALTFPSRDPDPRRTEVGAGELKAARVLAVGAVIAYNWWVVVLFVPGLMPSVNGFFSDLEADGRPHAALMSGADLVAGSGGGWSCSPLPVRWAVTTPTPVRRG